VIVYVPTVAEAAIALAEPPVGAPQSCQLWLTAVGFDRLPEAIGSTGTILMSVASPRATS